MKVSIIVAVSENNAIGKNNNLLWHLPVDMKFFKETTLGHCVVTGRKNYESIPEKFRPLAGRTNIVVTRNEAYAQENVSVVHSLEEAIALGKSLNEKELFIIGGGQIYDEAMKKNVVDRIYLTRVKTNLEADTFFPVLGNEWKLVGSKLLMKDEKNKYDLDFQIWEK